MAWTRTREELVDHIKQTGGQSWCLECLESFRAPINARSFGRPGVPYAVETDASGMYRHMDCAAAAAWTDAEA